MEGFIYLHRTLLNWEWVDDPVILKVFIFCLLKANHKENKWQGIVVERGSFITSIGKFSKELNISEMQLRNCIKKLKKSECITSKTTNKYTYISICNYDTYQTYEKDKQQANEQTNNKQITNKQQTNNKQITTNKNDKNKKNDKNINLIDKSIKEQSSEIMKEDKRIIEIDLIIETLKELNWWIIDDKVKQQRIFWKNIKNKFDKLQWFNGDYVWFIKILYQNSDEYRRQQFRSAEKFYYNIAGIIAGVKTQIQTKTKTVSV